MSKLKTALKLLVNNRDLFIQILLSKVASDRWYLKYWFKKKMGYALDLNNPKTFNEKLQWLKLYFREPIMTTMVDKYTVKSFVADKIGKKYIIPTLGVWEKFDDIDFEKLPDRFVLKCTHDSGGLVICKDKSKLDKAAARMKISNSLATDYYKLGREWPYKKVARRIIAEEYMEDSQTKDLRDYKFFCFNGVVHYFKVDFDRQTSHRANYFNKLGELQRFGEEICLPDFTRKIGMPVNLNKMISFAEELSQGFPFLRVDFYEIDAQIYFGELTFFPAAGVGKFVPEEWDTILGEKIILPN